MYVYMNILLCMMMQDPLAFNEIFNSPNKQVHGSLKEHGFPLCMHMYMCRVLPTLVGNGRPQPPLSFFFTTTRTQNGLFLPPLRENNSTKMRYSMQYNAIFTTD